MANSHEILFVRKNITDSRIPKITHIGGRLKEGAQWSIPTEEAISGIQSGRFEFFIQNDAGAVEKIVIARHRQLGSYLKSELDKARPDSLLNLPEGLPD